MKTNSLESWIYTARPNTLAAASCTVIIGTALAFRDLNAAIEWPAFILCLLFALLMQIDANFINDYFDYKKGSDNKEDRLGPKRSCVQGWMTTSALKVGIAITTIAACAVGFPLIQYGGWPMIIVGIACVFFCFLYSTFFSYKGMGDVLVIIFFGLIPVGFSYYIQTQSWNIETTLVAIACGMVIDALLVVNNYRDRYQDNKSKKNTIIVLISQKYGEHAGSRFGEYLYLCLGIIAIGLCVYPMVIKPSFLHGALLIIYLVLHFLSYRKLVRINHGKELNTVLKESARNILLFGLLVAISLCLAA